MNNPIHGNPLQGGAHVIAGQSSDRKTALALILGIAFAEMVLSGKLVAVWGALWGPVQPLKAPTSSSTSSPSPAQGSSS